MIVDALGTLTSFATTPENPAEYVFSWIQFIRSSLNQLQTLQEACSASPQMTLGLYEIQPTQTGWRAQPKTLPEDALDNMLKGIKVLISEQSDHKTSLQVFTAQAYSPAQLQGAPMSAGALAKNYIQNIVFAQPKPRIQLIDYIKARQSIEMQFKQGKG